ncbi:PREDICTED: uncharacterized protein LOC104748617 [Camelina sativa]|uniref:Uncharacterized protein LOC104748617 n=1 Tax=Camelina sativa TaxID=90675 RepID=A0ABM0WBB2_CAMSA|nr:PREDICTED: uncharacterized protein LOC104748617 [Camelina sativa]
MVKRYNSEHLCHPTRRCETIKTPIIADLFLEDIRRDPKMSGPEIKDEMKRMYNIIISPNQAKVARRHIFDKLQAECDEHFARLRDYELQLRTSNLHTTVEINTTRRDDGSENAMQGMMLTAVGRDPDNPIFPIAWAVVDCENNPNWEWFIRKLKEDLSLGLCENITLISDMHKGLIHGVATELPMAEHRACARHIYGNIKRDHKSYMLKPLFWRVASSYNKVDYKENLAIFKEFDPQACKTLLRKDPSSWCRAFSGRKPFVQMLELIRRDAMQRVVNRSIISEKEAAKFTKKSRKELEKSCEEAQYCALISSTGGEYEIAEFGIGYAVSLNRRECACRKWDLTGIPYRHAVCAIRELNLEVEDYIAYYYLSEKWKRTYRRGLWPVNGVKFWEDYGKPRIVAPPYKRPAGRPNGKARIKGLNESPCKKKSEMKVDRKGRIVHCAICGEPGYNSRKCPHESPESRAERRKLTETPLLEAQDQAEMGAAWAAIENQDQAAMEAALVAMENQDQDVAEVQNVSSTAPQGSQVVSF